MAGARVRHDRLVRVAVEIALQCAITARFHDGPIFDMGPLVAERRKRPADWFERGGSVTPADISRYYGGRCCDLTITTGGDAQLAAAVSSKEKQYSTAMAANQHLALTIFGISYTGAVSAGGLDTMKRWAACFARQRKFTADLPGMPMREVVSAFGLAFSVVVALQTAAYIGDVKGMTAMGKRAADWQRGEVRRSKRRPILDIDGGGQGMNTLAPI